MQAQDRAHRIGSDHESINIYQMYARGTIDSFMRDLINEKQKIFDQLIESENFLEAEPSQVESSLAAAISFLRAQQAEIE